MVKRIACTILLSAHRLIGHSTRRVLSDFATVVAGNGNGQDREESRNPTRPRSSSDDRSNDAIASRSVDVKTR